MSETRSDVRPNKAKFESHLKQKRFEQKDQVIIEQLEQLEHLIRFTFVDPPPLLASYEYIPEGWSLVLLHFTYCIVVLKNRKNLFSFFFQFNLPSTATINYISHRIKTDQYQQQPSRGQGWDFKQKTLTNSNY